METGKDVLVPAGTSETAPVSVVGEVFGIEVGFDIAGHTDPGTLVTVEVYESNTGQFVGGFTRIGGPAVDSKGNPLLDPLGNPATRAGIRVEHSKDGVIDGKLYKNVAPWVDPSFKTVITASKPLNLKLEPLSTVARSEALEETHHSLAVVQKVKAVGSLAASVTTAAISSTTGNLLVADMSFYTGNGVFSSIDDTATGNNTWSVARAVNTSAASAQISQYYAKNITGHASEAVKATATANAYVVLAVLEISGADTTAPLDVGGNATSSATTSHPVSTSATTTQADTIAVGLASSMLVTNAITEDGAYTTQSSDVTISTTRQGTRIVSAAGVQTRTVTTAGNIGLNLHIATYKQAAAGGASRVTKMAGAWGGFAGDSGGFAG